MFFRSTVSFRVVFLSALLSIMMLVADASGFTIYNFTSTPLRVRVLQGDFGPITINPGENASCHWSNTDCNPSGSQTAVLTAQIETLSGDSRDLNLLVSLEAGGWVSLYEWDPPFGKKQVHAIGRKTDGTVISQSPSGFEHIGGNSSAPFIPRHVKFLASADCQYCPPANCGEEDRILWNERAHATNAHMVNRVATESSLRGLILAGDLTQNGWLQEKNDFYIPSVAGLRRFVYEGAGNHDIRPGPPVDFIPDMIHEAKHTTVKAAKADYMHYSWDWHDVHFVQLNLMPADEESTGDYPIDPYSALSFLQADLAINVGSSSQRPVVLIYHYGHGAFSVGTSGTNGFPRWWDDDQRLAAWNAIAPYNVVLIINGHIHLTPSDVSTGVDGTFAHRFVMWQRPTGTSSGPTSIPTVVAGAALNDAFIEVEINSVNQIKIDVWDTNSDSTSAPAITGTKFLSFDTPIWIDQNGPSRGYGWWQRPYSTFNDAINALSARFAGSPDPEVVLNFEPGSYNETGTYNPGIPITLSPTAGPVTIGQ